jgi:predicted RecA/RadA family phage recombinase
MRNYNSDVNNFGIIAPNDLKGGELFALGSLVLVSAINVKKGERVTAISSGIFKFEIAGEFTIGQVAYYLPTTKVISCKKETGAITIGYTLDAGSSTYSRVLFSSLISNGA